MLLHCLHYLEASDALCKKQLLERSKDKPIGTPFTTEKEFDEVNMYFEPPSNDEGFKYLASFPQAPDESVMPIKFKHRSSFKVTIV